MKASTLFFYTLVFIAAKMAAAETIFENSGQIKNATERASLFQKYCSQPTLHPDYLANEPISNCFRRHAEKGNKTNAQCAIDEFIAAKTDPHCDPATRQAMDRGVALMRSQASNAMAGGLALLISRLSTSKIHSIGVALVGDDVMDWGITQAQSGLLSVNGHCDKFIEKRLNETKNSEERDRYLKVFNMPVVSKGCKEPEMNTKAYKSLLPEKDSEVSRVKFFEDNPAICQQLRRLKALQTQKFECFLLRNSEVLRNIEAQNPEYKCVKQGELQIKTKTNLGTYAMTVKTSAKGELTAEGNLLTQEELESVESQFQKLNIKKEDFRGLMTRRKGTKIPVADWRSLNKVKAVLHLDIDEDPEIVRIFESPFFGKISGKTGTYGNASVPRTVPKFGCSPLTLKDLEFNSLEGAEAARNAGTCTAQIVRLTALNFDSTEAEKCGIIPRNFFEVLTQQEAVNKEIDKTLEEKVYKNFDYSKFGELTPVVPAASSKTPNKSAPASN